jgi:predicted ATP-grasp superfamily ATP-dependent carboligase
MPTNGFQLENHLPTLSRPWLIAGFMGWGNALNVAAGAIDYLAKRFAAQKIGSIDSDAFYRYDETRPVVRIEDGRLQSLEFPGGALYAAGPTGSGGRDLILLKADEPHLRWRQFADALFETAGLLGVDTVISLGSMLDTVLHTERLVSGLASTDALTDALQTQGIAPISYEGPSAIHSTLLMEGSRRGMKCISLWGHCAFYLQGATHFGLMSHLVNLLAKLGGFPLDTEELESAWKRLHEHIQGLIEKNEELQKLIGKLRKEKMRGNWNAVKPPADSSGKLINLKDFLEPK